MQLIDSHAHLTDEQFGPDGDLVVERARQAGVVSIVTIATHADDWKRSLDLAARLSGVYASLGIHPHSADLASDAAMTELERLAADVGVVAIGETGLDYHYDNAPRELQRSSFARHLDLGRRLSLPIVVHSRDADADTVAILREAGQGTTGVLHCFTGGRVLMEAALNIGWYVSFAGIITFARYVDADLLRSVPLDRVLIETDSPYLAPVPHRGRRNEPAFLVEVARRAAVLRGEDFDEFLAATVRNARRLYRLEESAA